MLEGSKKNLDLEFELIKLQADMVLLQKEIARLSRENEAISTILNKRVKPVVDAFYWYNEVKQKELNNSIGVSYFG